MAIVADGGGMIGDKQIKGGRMFSSEIENFKTMIDPFSFTEKLFLSVCACIGFIVGGQTANALFGPICWWF